MTIATKPARMMFVNLATGIELVAQFNPTEVEELLTVNWAELATPGSSHGVHQYSNTDSLQFTFTLRFASDDGSGQNKIEDVRRARRFFHSLGYARRGGQDVVGGSPSRFLFVWPSMASLTCAMHSASIKHRKSNINGESTILDVELTIKEARDVRIFAEDVATGGTFRSDYQDPELGY